MVCCFLISIVISHLCPEMQENSNVYDKERESLTLTCSPGHICSFGHKAVTKYCVSLCRLFLLKTFFILAYKLG